MFESCGTSSVLYDVALYDGADRKSKLLWGCRD